MIDDSTYRVGLRLYFVTEIASAPRMVGFPFSSKIPTGGIRMDILQRGGGFAFIVIYGFWEGFWIEWLYTRVVSVSVGSLWEPGGTFLALWVKGVRTGGRGAVEPLLPLLIDTTSRS